MDKFILYKENIDLFDNFINFVGNHLLYVILMLPLAYYCLELISLIVFTNSLTISDNLTKKNTFLVIMKILIIISIIVVLIEASQTEKAKNYEQQFKEQTVQLKDIKELIHVDGDKLTIDPLTNKSKNYYYNSDIYKNNERQLFRIDHDDVFEEYQLVDKNNNKIKISKEDYKELRKGD